MPTSDTDNDATAPASPAPGTVITPASSTARPSVRVPIKPPQPLNQQNVPHQAPPPKPVPVKAAPVKSLHPNILGPAIPIADPTGSGNNKEKSVPEHVETMPNYKTGVGIFRMPPLSLLIAVFIALVPSVFILVKPLQSDSQNLRLVIAAAVILSLLSCVGLLLRFNWARSLYVTVTVIAIITQGIMIYHIQSSPLLLPYSTTNAASPKTFAYYRMKAEQKIDPIYKQSDERLGLILAQFIAIYLLTTPYMHRVFKKR